MAQSFDITGGARVGWMNATWPLAQLSATADSLRISVFLLGTYSFTPDQVSSIERYVMIPVLGWGIQVRHCVPEYPRKIIFWSLGSPERLLSGISGSGFQPAATPSTMDGSAGIPVRWSAIIVAVAVWNGLFLLDQTRSVRPHSSPGLYSCIALLLLYGLALGTLRLPVLQRFVLKPGRNVGEIGTALRFLAFISGFMLLVFTILLLTGAFDQTV
jgi:hypothetical protein